MILSSISMVRFLSKLGQDEGLLGLLLLWLGVLSESISFGVCRLLGTSWLLGCMGDGGISLGLGGVVYVVLR